MKNMKWSLLGVVLLICVTALGVPAAASTSGTTSVTGVVPLTIRDVQASGITCHSATISWQTNGNATSQVFYDTQPHTSVADYAYQSALDSTLVTAHTVQLGTLFPSTYHYRVESVAEIDSIEFIAISQDYNFNTSGTCVAPSVTTVFALPLPQFAIFLGRLNSMGTASSVEVYFQWGKTKDYGNETAHWTLTGAPNIFLAVAASLTPNTTYHFRAVAVGDGTSYGQDQVFRTTRR
jgi:hypothetical protein